MKAFNHLKGLKFFYFFKKMPSLFRKSICYAYFIFNATVEKQDNNSRYSGELLHKVILSHVSLSFLIIVPGNRLFLRIPHLYFKLFLQAFYRFWYKLSCNEYILLAHPGATSLSIPP